MISSIIQMTKKTRRFWDRLNNDLMTKKTTGFPFLCQAIYLHGCHIRWQSTKSHILLGTEHTYHIKETKQAWAPDTNTWGTQRTREMWRGDNMESSTRPCCWRYSTPLFQSPTNSGWVDLTMKYFLSLPWRDHESPPPCFFVSLA